MIRHLVAASIFTLLAGAAAAQTAAQTAVHYRADQRVDPADVVRILGGAPAAAPGLTRSIRLLAEPGAAAARPAEPAPADALSLPVQFAFGSAEILPAARPQLDALAAGIQMLPPERGVVIEGHTDAVGSDAVNLVLSQRRALAVKTYLVLQHGIDAARLQPQGLGETRLIEGLPPAAGAHRRVQFRGA